MVTSTHGIAFLKIVLRNDTDSLSIFKSFTKIEYCLTIESSVFLLIVNLSLMYAFNDGNFLNVEKLHINKYIF